MRQEEVKEQILIPKLSPHSKPLIINDSLLAGDDIDLGLDNDLPKLNNTIQKDENMNSVEEAESNHEEIQNNVKIEVYDKYDNIFAGIDQGKSDRESLYEFDIPDPNEQFNYNNNNDQFNRMNPFSYDFMDSEKPQTMILQNNDIEMNVQKGNKNYLSKMKKTLKDTLKKNHR